MWDKASHSHADQTGSSVPTTVKTEQFRCLHVNRQEGWPVHAATSTRTCKAKLYLPTREAELATMAASHLALGVNLRRPVCSTAGRQAGRQQVWAGFTISAPQVHPPPCDRGSSTSPALINLITSCIMEPRPIHLSAQLCSEHSLMKRQVDYLVGYWQNERKWTLNYS